MRTAALLIAGLSLLSASVFAEEPAPASTDGVLPLTLLEASRSGDDNAAGKGSIELAVAALAETPQGRSGLAINSPDEMRFPYRMDFDAPGVTTAALKAGTIKLLKPGADHSLVLWVKASMGDNYTYTVPVALSRSGNTLTLVLEHWYDNGDRDKSYSVQYNYLIDSGKLAAGEYNLRLVVRSFLLGDQKGSVLKQAYRSNSTREGALKFSVGETSAAGDVPVLKEAKAIPSGPALDAFWQLPRCAKGAARAEKHPNPGVYAGTLDIQAWLKSTRVEAPELTAPAPADPVYAMVVGPLMNSGDSIRLRSICNIFDTKKITLEVELYQDDRPRLQNVRSHPVLLVPLQFSGAGTYTVEVQWIGLHAKDSSGPYVPESDAVAAALKKLENTRELVVAADPNAVTPKPSSPRNPPPTAKPGANSDF